jgi:hypothetical protein
MNPQLVDSIVQLIYALSESDRHLLEEKLFFDPSEPTTSEIMHLAQIGGSFDWLYDEPDLYTLQDGEPIG